MTDTSLQLQARALGDPTRHSIFRYVVDSATLVDVAELTEHMGLNHNAIRQHLAKLELRTMFEQLIPRLESIDILGKGSVTHTNFVGGLKHLPAKVTVS